ncbi:hypothetical protein [Nonomuraea sp. NPDC049480]|uniref:hypothetical protein n=1 Tax=Nonomuraea sp. NPDC049480 TaxID=3364353 RepID=UPI0037995D83
MSPADRVLRLARAIVFTTVCIVVTAAGHAFAGGDSSTPWVLLVGAAATLGPAYVLSGREHGLGFVLGVTVAAQAFLHELFTRNAPIPVDDVVHSHFGFGMGVAHLVVAVVTGWYLHRGDSALWLMLRLWAKPSIAVLWWLATPVVPPRARVLRIPTPPAPRVPTSWELPAAVSRRGPPSLSVAA